MASGQCLMRKADPAHAWNASCPNWGTCQPLPYRQDSNGKYVYDYPGGQVWRTDCSGVYHGSDWGWAVGMLPGNTATPGSGSNNTVSCAITSWNPSMKSACCSGASTDFDAQQCDPEWCLFSDQCVPETQTYCNQTQGDGTRRFENDTSCNQDSNWRRENPAVWDTMVSQFCNDPANILKPVCQAFCMRTDTNCDAGQSAYVKQQWAAAGTDVTKQDAVIVDEMAACFLDAAQPDFYGKLFDARAKYLQPGGAGGSALPEYPECIYPPCASSRFQTFAEKNRPSRCPNVEQCISVTQINNDGTINNSTINAQNTNNCSFTAQACKPGQRFDPTPGVGGGCFDCPAGTVVSADGSTCVSTAPTGPTGPPTGPTGPPTGPTGPPTGPTGPPTGPTGGTWARIRAWAKANPVPLAVGAASIVALGILLGVTARNRRRRVSAQRWAQYNAETSNVVPGPNGLQQVYNTPDSVAQLYSPGPQGPQAFDASQQYSPEFYASQYAQQGLQAPQALQGPQASAGLDAPATTPFPGVNPPGFNSSSPSS
jgi:hypothetical protein